MPSRRMTPSLSTLSHKARIGIASDIMREMELSFTFRRSHAIDEAATGCDDSDRVYNNDTCVFRRGCEVDAARKAILRLSCRTREKGRDAPDNLP